MDSKKLNNIVSAFEKHYHDETKKKKSSGILDTLIATKLSQNTTDKTSSVAFGNLKREFKIWDDLSNAPVSKIKNLIKICGLAETKSKDIKDMILQIKKERGKVNLDYLKKLSDEEVYSELCKYKGIGVKTASCVLVFSLGRDVFPVDTHIHRVLNRLGIVNTKSAEETFEKAKDIIPGKKKYFLHRAIIMFGRNICRSNNPYCGSCFLYSQCKFKEKNKTNIKRNNQENNFLILDGI
ncbi:MAG: endonuclease III [Ignavibacteriae bacterium]|nr:endonuclease III [Ignavibacteriota bacterium]